jgi:hypothetical protein
VLAVQDLLPLDARGDRIVQFFCCRADPRRQDRPGVRLGLEQAGDHHRLEGAEPARLGLSA